MGQLCPQTAYELICISGLYIIPSFGMESESATLNTSMSTSNSSVGIPAAERSIEYPVTLLKVPNNSAVDCS